MVVFSIKLLNQLRKAIAGRRFPRQMAGGVALGVLLGVIPHGNLLAAVVLFVVLCFRVNHALMTLVAVLVTFGGATHLDAYSSQLGEYVLTHPVGHEYAAKAWKLPLVPWTDLNNTVVLGSFLIGLTATLPIYAITLPIFKRFAPTPSEEDEVAESETAESQATDRQAEAQSEEKNLTSTQAAEQDPQPQQERKQTRELTVAKVTEKSAPSTEALDAVHSDDTQVSVIRMSDYRDAQNKRDASKDPADPAADLGLDDKKMDEALNYLLQQLRHAQQRKSAG